MHFDAFKTKLMLSIMLGKVHDIVTLAAPTRPVFLSALNARLPILVKLVELVVHL